MKICKSCGTKNEDSSLFCVSCGASLENCEVTSDSSTTTPSATTAPAQKSSGSIWYGVLGFFIPLVGLILFLVWKNDPLRRGDSKNAGIGALIGFIISVVTSIVYLIIYIAILLPLIMQGATTTYLALLSL